VTYGVQRVRDFAERGWHWQLAFLYANHGPSCAAQTPRYPLVAALIRFNLLAPKARVALGQVLTPMTTMPETAIDKDCEFNAGSSKIWMAIDWPVLSISTQTCLPEHAAEHLFGAPVPPEAHGGHDS
jgi:hypothetical protein